MTRFSARILAPVALGLGAVTLAACSDSVGEAGTTSETDANSTIADVLASSGDHSTLAAALSDSGLAKLFEGPGSYTILAPVNAAFEAEGTGAAELLEEEQRPILVAILRGHMIPGHLTAEAIAEAAELGGGPVEMRTLGGGIVTFTNGEGGLVASGPDGTSVKVTGQAAAANNGVVIPVDGLLAAPPAEE